MVESIQGRGGDRAGPPPALARRCGAWVVDAVLTAGAALGGLAWLAVAEFTRHPAARLLGAAYLAWAAWYLLTRDAGPGGAGIGKAGFDLLLVDAVTGAPCSRRRTAARALVGAVLWLIPIAEPLAVLGSRRRRGIADLVAGTAVVQATAAGGALRPRRVRWRIGIGLAVGVGALAGLTGVTITSRLPEARVDTARSNLVTIRDGVAFMASRSGRLPASLDEVPLHPSQRRDPWGRPYLYEPSRAGTDGLRFTLRTLGADGAPGGEGQDADLEEIGGQTGSPAPGRR